MSLFLIAYCNHNKCSILHPSYSMIDAGLVISNPNGNMVEIV